MFHLRLLTVLLATTAPATMAWADDATKDQAAASAPGTIAEVIVTAQRREESLQKVPIAVTAVSPAALETAGVVSSLDLPRVAPGLTTAPTVANAIFVPYLRGVGSNSPATGNDSSIAVYIDGVYQSDKLANIFDFADIQRIEVLKGPQGTLFGRNATGGAINIVTLQPKDTLSGSAEASYQRFNRFTAKGYLTGPLSDTLSASLAVQHIGGGDFLTNTGKDDPGKFGGTKSNSVDAKLRFTPSDRFEALASLMFVDRSTDDLGSNLYPVPGTKPVGVLLGGRADFGLYEYSGSPNLVATKTYRATLKARYSLDAVDIVSLTGYVHSRDHNKLDFDGTTADISYFDEVQGTKDFSQEVQVLSTGSGPLQWVLGGYYSRNKAYINPLDVGGGVPFATTDAENGTIGPAASFPAGGSVTSILARGPTRSVAAYGQATYALTDSTHLTAGLRYTSEHREYTFAVRGVGQIAPGFFLPALTTLFTDDGQRSRTFNKLTWRLAVDQQLSPDVMTYASWNRGFKSGTFNLNGFTPSQAAVNPEQLDAYEVGLKGQFFERRLQFNAAAFYYDYKNIQVDIITGDPQSPTSLQNAASERNYGLDLDLIFQPVPNLQLRANGALLNAKYKEYKDANAFTQDANGNGMAVKVDASGQRGLFAPKWTFNLGADYTIHLDGGGTLLSSASYYRTATYKTGIGPLDRVREYDSLGASLTYTLPDDHYYVRIYGSNLTNRKVISNQLLQLKYTRNEIQPSTFGIAIGGRF